jgi:NADP-dependent 3-hydroxy acid dehydrogenase YdfG
MSSMSSLKGQLIAVTGAASGIGRATSQLLAQSGAILSLADMNGEAVQHLAKSLTDNGGDAFWKQVDVRNREEVDAWIRDTVQIFGRPLDGESGKGNSELCAGDAGILGSTSIDKSQVR